MVMTAGTGRRMLADSLPPWWLMLITGIAWMVVWSDPASLRLHLRLVDLAPVRLRRACGRLHGDRVGLPVARLVEGDEHHPGARFHRLRRGRVHSSRRHVRGAGRRLQLLPDLRGGLRPGPGDRREARDRRLVAAADRRDHRDRARVLGGRLLRPERRAARRLGGRLRDHPRRPRHRARISRARDPARGLPRSAPSPARGSSSRAALSPA